MCQLVLAPDSAFYNWVEGSEFSFPGKECEAYEFHYLL